MQLPSHTPGDSMICQLICVPSGGALDRDDRARGVREESRGTRTSASTGSTLPRNDSMRPVPAQVSNGTTAGSAVVRTDKLHNIRTAFIW
ncbi:hypothetical protein Trydic_g23755 [Trypoxylus dichotomus]